MKSVGVVGGIGSGKTTVCKVWEKLGATVIYADDLAKELMQTDSELQKKLVTIFGSDTYNSDGSLNKPHLINEAFNKNRVDELNKAVHPVLREKLKELAGSSKKAGEELFVVEAAILLNEGRPDFPEIIVLVTADRDRRFERVAKRDQASGDEILARMDKQPDFKSLTHLADFTIKNDGALSELEESAVNLFEELKST